MAIWLAVKYQGIPNELKQFVDECKKSKREFRIAADDPDQAKELFKDFKGVECLAIVSIKDESRKDYL